MKRIIPLILALLLLAACGEGVAEATPTAGVSATPEPTEIVEAAPVPLQEAKELTE